MVNIKVLIIVLFVNYVISVVTNENNHYVTKIPSPLVIVPGNGGSRAYANINYYLFTVERLIWLDQTYMFFPGSLTNHFKLIYDPETHTTTNVYNTKILFPGWGSTETIEELDEHNHLATYFAPLVKELIKDKFYLRNKTLRGAPYDFRRAPNENLFIVDALKVLIEDTYNQSGNQRVVLLGHSMGSLYWLYFLNKMDLSWKKKFIRSFISVSGSLAGTVKAVRLETTGDSIDSPRNPYDFREMQRSFPSSAFLLPAPGIFGKKPIVITSGRNYSAHDYEALFSDMGFHFGIMMYNDTKDLIDATKTPEGIDELYCFYGYGLPTVEQLVFTHFPDVEQKLIYGDGDSIVNLQSLEVCKKWKNVKRYTIKGASHTNILDDSRFIKKLKEILYN